MASWIAEEPGGGKKGASDRERSDAFSSKNHLRIGPWASRLRTPGRRQGGLARVEEISQRGRKEVAKSW